MTETNETTHVFDWHAEPEGSFLKWAMLNFAGFSRIGKDQFEALSDATDKFSRVELGITVGGIEVDAKAFMDNLDQAMDWAVEREAKKLLLSRIPGLDGIYEVLAELEREVKGMIVTSAEQAGFEITEDDWRDR